MNGGAISSLDGGISPDIVNLSSGIYSVEVMDTYGCTSSMSYVMMEPSSISIEIEQNDPSCFGFNDGQLKNFILINFFQELIISLLPI